MRVSSAYTEDPSACSWNLRAWATRLGVVQVGAARYDGGNFKQAAAMFAELATAPALADFLTLPAYDVIVKKDTVEAQSRL